MIRTTAKLLDNFIYSFDQDKFVLVEGRIDQTNVINDHLWCNRYREMEIYCDSADGKVNIPPLVVKAVLIGIKPYPCLNVRGLRTDLYDNIPLFPNLQHLEMKILEKGIKMKKYLEPLEYLTSIKLTGEGSIEYEPGMFDGITSLKISCGIENETQFKNDLKGKYFIHASLPKGFQGVVVAESEYVNSTIR